VLSVTALRSRIDHIVVTAPSLEVGVDYVRNALGVIPQAGGVHQRMGTHNCLLRLGKTVYLEVISIDPSAPNPGRPRWLELDRKRPNTAPRLATWICRTNDIRAATAVAASCLGDIETMSRGALHWQITIPADGSLPFDGTAPSLIEWSSENHPAESLQDAGCSLLRLEAYHPAAPEISRMLQSIGFEGGFSVQPVSQQQPARLVAHIQTPTGIRQLH